VSLRTFAIILERHLWLLTLYRGRCLFKEATISNDNVDAIMQNALKSAPREANGLRSFALTQSALLHELLGESNIAIADLTAAYDLAALSDYSFSAADAAGKLALIQAMLGDIHLAEVWVGREESAPAPDGLPPTSVRRAGIVARALIAIRTLRGDQSAAALDDSRSSG